jgi:hypothetical protein
MANDRFGGGQRADFSPEQRQNGERSMNRSMVLALPIALVALAASAATAQSGPITQVPPAPPKSYPEFFNPTYTDHEIDATCAASKMTLRWKFTSRGVQLTALRFNGTASSSAELEKINEWLAAFPGDALARIECGNEGAVVTFIESNLAGSPAAKRIKFSWHSEKADLIGRYGFE